MLAVIDTRTGEVVTHYPIAQADEENRADNLLDELCAIVNGGNDLELEPGEAISDDGQPEASVGVK